MAKSLKSLLLALFCIPNHDSTEEESRKLNEDQKGHYELMTESPPFEGRSRVYWGKLKDGQEIAVKRFNSEFIKDIEEFKKEAQFLGQFHHKNLVCLKGLCAEAQERMLVFDFMRNSSLFAHLHGDLENEGQLTWQRRMAIAIGCARGLAHLHHHSTPQLVHGDIKSTNVLLKSNFEPCLGDFGMSNLLKSSVAKSRGAAGYIAPEHYKGEQELSRKSDVFSFGILLLELITGRNPSEKVLGDAGKLSILEWVQNLMGSGKHEELVDPKLENNYDREDLKVVLNTAVTCCQDGPENRPSMTEVVDLLAKGPA